MNAAARRRPSTSLVITVGLVLAVFVMIVIPNMMPARFEWASVPLAVRLRVFDQNTHEPIAGAKVMVPGPNGEVLTDGNGECEAIGRFGATGTVGRSGKMHLHGTMKISAPGYQEWEESLVLLFGPSFDYFNKGTSVTHTVSLKQLPSQAKR